MEHNLLDRIYEKYGHDNIHFAVQEGVEHVEIAAKWDARVGQKPEDHAESEIRGWTGLPEVYTEEECIDNAYWEIIKTASKEFYTDITKEEMKVIEAVMSRHSEMRITLSDEIKISRWTFCADWEEYNQKEG